MSQVIYSVHPALLVDLLFPKLKKICDDAAVEIKRAGIIHHSLFGVYDGIVILLFCLLDPLANGDGKKKFLLLSMVSPALMAHHGTTLERHILSSNIVALLMKYAGSKDTLNAVAKETVRDLVLLLCTEQNIAIYF